MIIPSFFAVEATYHRQCRPGDWPSGGRCHSICELWLPACLATATKWRTRTGQIFPSTATTIHRGQQRYGYVLYQKGCNPQPCYSLGLCGGPPYGPLSITSETHASDSYWSYPVVVDIVFASNFFLSQDVGAWELATLQSSFVRCV